MVQIKIVTIILTVIFLAFYSCNSDKVVLEKWNNGKPKVILEFKDVKDSIFTKIEYFESEKIKSTQEYVKGKMSGKEIKYSEKGFKYQEFDYLNGQKNGIGTAWYESGKISFQFKYKHGLYYDGTEYFENGWPRVLVRFSAPGQREGKAFYYKEDGYIWMEGYFKNGKEDSIWRKFDNAGNVIDIIKYNAGNIIQ
jgi:antitoxin component YwqK of YwqJK toxin-antitoxin module